MTNPASPETSPQNAPRVPPPSNRLTSGDVVFVPGAAELGTVREIVAGIGGPVSLMVVPGMAPAAEMFAAGVNRISLGPAAMLATLGTLRRLASEIREAGDWAALSGHGFGFGDAEALFAR